MSKERLLETLFTEWCENHKDSQEYNKVSGMLEAEELAGKKHVALVDCVIAESRQAFTAGFNAAVALLTGGVQ